MLEIIHDFHFPNETDIKNYKTWVKLKYRSCKIFSRGKIMETAILFLAEKGATKIIPSYIVIWF